MAPARTTTDSDDPVTAEYDIYLTPSSSSPTNAQQNQIYVIQYPNRPRDKPYNARHGNHPHAVRIKPQTGYLEMDVNLHTEHNFNRYRGLKWGEAMNSSAAQQSQQGSNTNSPVGGGSATFGIASGFQNSAYRPPPGRMGAATAHRLKSDAEREGDIADDLKWFHDAQDEGRVWHTQTLGGQILPAHQPGMEEKPVYFVGAFRGSELHLSKVDGMAQLRPQFHHLDAEDARARLAAQLQHQASAATAPGEHMSAPRVVTQTYKPSSAAASGNPKGELEAREMAMRTHLKNAHEEAWVPLEYVDEDAAQAYSVFEERLFVHDTSEPGCARLRSAMGDEEFLEAISAPGRESPTKRRRRRERRKDEEVEEDGG